MHEPEAPLIRFEEIKAAAPSVADKLAAAPGGSSGRGGSAHRGLAEDVRLRVIAIRTALFERGIYDPVLGRFDSATVAQASNEEIAARLREVAQAL